MMCRWCLQGRAEAEERLFEGRRGSALCRMLLLCTGLQMEAVEGLPDAVCVSCVNRLVDAFRFRLKCHQNDRRLRSQLVQQSRDKPEIESDDVDVLREFGYENDENGTLHQKIKHPKSQRKRVTKIRRTRSNSKKIDKKKNEFLKAIESNVERFKFELKNEMNELITLETDLNIENNERFDEFDKNSLRSDIKREEEDSIKFEQLNFDNSHIIEDASVNDSTDLCMSSKENTSEKDITAIDTGLNISAKEKKSPKKKLYFCDYCGHSVRMKFDLIAHFRRHTGEKPYKCETCGKRFTYDSGLRTHQNQHTGYKGFICDICGKGLSTKETLLAHRRLHTGELPFECSTCGRAFRALTNLRTHRKIHTGDKRHSCQVCNKMFYTKSDMRNHARRHTGERPFACTLCPKQFTGRSNYKLHMKIHAGQKDFQCPECPKTFVSKDSMRRHGRTHTGERLFECQDCGRRFAHRSTLVSHRAIHSKTKDYICDICCQRFAYPSGLYVHRKKKHNIQSNRFVKNPVE